LNNSELLKQEIRESGIKANKIIEELGITRTTYAKWFKNLTDTRADKIRSVLEKFKMKVAEPAVGYNGKKYKLSNFNVVSDLRGDIYSHDNIVGHLPVPDENPDDRLVAIRIPDTSMQHSGENSLTENSFVIIDPEEELYDGDIVALATTAGRHFVRRMKTNKDTYTLIADNEKYPDFEIPKEEVEEIYSVVGFCGKYVRWK